MRSPVALVVPGNLDARTGGYIYDRHIVDGLRAKGWVVDVHQLDDSFPRPSPAATQHADAVLAGLTGGTLTLIDSLAVGAMPAIIERHAGRLRIVALVHLPLAADVGIDAGTAAQFAEDEGRALAAAALVVVTGQATQSLLAPYNLRRDRIVIIEPGTDPAPLARGSSGSPVQLLSVATLNPGKGHLDLVTALAHVPSRNWQLTCAGSLTRHPSTAAAVRATVRELRIEDRVSLEGELDAATLADRYDRSDVFVLATLRETYGMAVAEALARGLPIVSTMTGAIPDLVGNGAGLLVTPGDRPALTDALTRVVEDREERARLAEGAHRVRETLPAWDVSVAKMAAALESISHG